MVNYTYKEVEDALLVSGFAPKKNDGGSHQMYKNPVTGLSQPIPKHGKKLASGTAESVLDYAVFSAYLQRINICSDKYKLSQNVVNYTKKVHKEMKGNNIIRLIPAKILQQNGIGTTKEAQDYLKKMFDLVKINEKNNKVVKDTKNQTKTKHDNNFSGYEMGA